MKYQNLLLAGLAIGGFYLFMKKPKGAVTKKSTSKRSGSSGGSIGSGVKSQMENSEIGVNIFDLTANTPSMRTCITNPSIIGCDELLPSLVNAKVKGDVISQIMESTNKDTKIANPSYEEDMGGYYEEDMGGYYEEDMGGSYESGDVYEATPVGEDGSISYDVGVIRNPDGSIGSGDSVIRNPDGSISYGGGVIKNPDGSSGYDVGVIKNPDGSIGSGDSVIRNPDGSISYGGGVIKNPDGSSGSGDAVIKNPDGSISRGGAVSDGSASAGSASAGSPSAGSASAGSATKVSFSGNRVDGYFESQVSSSRKKGRKDKYDFDGEYGTFLDDSF